VLAYTVTESCRCLCAFSCARFTSSAYFLRQFDIRSPRRCASCRSTRDANNSVPTAGISNRQGIAGHTCAAADVDVRSVWVKNWSGIICAGAASGYWSHRHINGRQTIVGPGHGAQEQARCCLVGNQQTVPLYARDNGTWQNQDAQAWPVVCTTGEEQPCLILLLPYLWHIDVFQTM
jgi:hypothetical protein